MEEMYRKNASRLSYEELYRTAYTLVLKKYAEKLYNSFKGFIGDHLCEVVKTELVPLMIGISVTSADAALSMVVDGSKSNGSSQDAVAAGAVGGVTTNTPSRSIDAREGGMKFLNAVKSQWDDHCLCMRMISDILMYMVSCRLIGAQYSLLNCNNWMLIKSIG